MPWPDTYTHSLRLLRVLQSLFTAQARDVLSRLSLDAIESGGQLPDLTHWVHAVSAGTKPIVLHIWQTGMLRSMSRVAHLLGGQSPASAAEGMRRHVLEPSEIFGAVVRQVWPAPPPVSSEVLSLPIQQMPVWPVSRPVGILGSRFDLFQPRVLDAVDAATMTFARTTNETATKELEESISDLRSMLKEGLARGDALGYLANQVQRIFAHPSRAYAIAGSEASRAIHGGALMAARENKVVKGKQWLSHDGACERCQKLDGKIKKLDQPFHVDPAGGPYALTYHPPLHVACECDFTEVI